MAVILLRAARIRVAADPGETAWVTTCQHCHDWWDYLSWWEAQRKADVHSRHCEALAEHA